MPNSDFRKIGRWMLVFTVLAALSLAAVLTVGRRSMRMSSAMAASANPTAFAELAPGSTTQAVVEITPLMRMATPKESCSIARARICTGEPATVVGIKFSDATPVVMGKLGDLHAGAVVHVKGTVGDDHRIAAEQIVILTGYVQVQ